MGLLRVTYSGPPRTNSYGNPIEPGDIVNVTTEEYDPGPFGLSEKTEVYSYTYVQPSFAEQNRKKRQEQRLGTACLLYSLVSALGAFLLIRHILRMEKASILTYTGLINWLPGDEHNDPQGKPEG